MESNFLRRKAIRIILSYSSDLRKMGIVFHLGGLMIGETTEIERLEASILGEITKISRGSKILSDLVVSVELARSKLRNLISAYRGKVTQEEIDSLIYAIIYDNALSKRDLLFSFDMTQEDFEACTKRLNERRRPE